MTPAALVAAALRELLAPTPDPTQANAYIFEIPTDDLDAVAERLVQLAGMACGRQASLRVKAMMLALPIKPTQHCTSEECAYTFSHTAGWCHYAQPRRCGCAYCYPTDGLESKVMAGYAS